MRVLTTRRIRGKESNYLLANGSSPATASFNLPILRGDAEGTPTLLQFQRGKRSTATFHSQLNHNVLFRKTMRPATAACMPQRHVQNSSIPRTRYCLTNPFPKTISRKTPLTCFSFRLG